MSKTAKFIVAKDDDKKEVTILCRRPGERTYSKYMAVTGNWGAETLDKAHDLVKGLTRIGAKHPRIEQKPPID